MAGETETALDEVDLAERLSPRDAYNNHYPIIRGVACFAASDYQSAATHAREGIRLRSDATGAYRVLAAASGQLGLFDDAQLALASLLQLQPEITLRWARKMIPIPNSEFLDRYVEGLKLAGVPE